MLKIPCPFCGSRDETEFSNGGPVKILRPQDPAALSAEAWVEYLTVADNPIGPVHEHWWHVQGCGSWFEITRNTLTHKIIDSSRHE